MSFHYYLAAVVLWVSVVFARPSDGEGFMM